MGYGAHGSPLAEDGAVVVFHYDRETAASSYVFDYSGFGTNAVKESDSPEDLLADWSVPGHVFTPLPSYNDYHQVSNQGYYISNGEIKFVSQQAGVNAEFSESTESLIVNQDRFNFYTPNVAYMFSISGGWVKADSFPGSIGASIQTNAIVDDFAGFSPTGFIGPDGNNYSSPMASDIVLAGSPTITLSATNHGAITSILFNGNEFLYVDTKANATQQRWEFGSDYVLSETGFDSYSPTESPASRFISSGYNLDSAVTRVFPAYSEIHNNLEASGHIAGKRVSLGYLGNPRILELDSTLNLHKSIGLKNFTWTHSVTLTSPFTSVLLYSVGTFGPPTGTPSVLTQTESGIYHIDTNIKGGVILSSVDGAQALGLYHHGPSRKEHRILTDVRFNTSPDNHVVFTSREFNTAGEGYAPGIICKTRYLCAGTLGDVIGAFTELYSHEEGVVGAPSGSAVRIAITSISTDLNGLSPSEEFSVGLAAVNSSNSIDLNWNAPITVSDNVGDIQGTTSGTFVDGEATISGMSFDEYGVRTVKFSSSVLLDAEVQCSVPYPKPVLTGITPSSGFLGDDDVEIAMAGSGFTAESLVLLTGIPVDPSYVVYNSPTSIDVTLTAAVQSTPGVKRLSVMNPDPGGGVSLVKPFFVAVPPPTVYSPHYLDVEVVGTTTFVVGDDIPFVIDCLSSPSGVVSTIATGLVYVSLVPVFSGTTLALGSASPVNGTILFNGQASLAGNYWVKVTHSPQTGEPQMREEIETAYIIDVANVTPILSGISPSWLSPDNNAHAIALYGYNFVDQDSIGYFNNLPRATTWISSNRLDMQLALGDVATSGDYPIRVSTQLANPTDSDELVLNVSPTPPPISVASPAYLSIQLQSSGIKYVGNAFGYTVSVLDSPTGLLADYANGIIRIRSSPVAPYTGTGSGVTSGTATNSVFSGGFAINNFGDYKVIATYSPAAGEPAVRQSSVDVTMYFSQPQLTKLSPTSFSPGSASQTVHVFGSQFNTGLVVPTINYYALGSSSSVFTQRSPTVIDTGHLTFSLSPLDYSTAIQVPAVSVQVSGAFVPESGKRSITLHPAAGAVDSPEYLSFYPDLNSQFETVPTQLRVGTAVGAIPSATSVVYAYTENDNVATTATGDVLLTVSPVGPYTGTYSGRAAIQVDGTATFTGVSVNAIGTYVFKATHSPTGGVGLQYSPSYAQTVTYVLNQVPTVTSLSPSTFASSSSGQTVAVFGSNFLATSYAKFNDSTRNTVFISPGEIRANLTGTDTSTPGLHVIKAFNVFSASGGTDAFAARSLTITGSGGLTDETLPATVLVSPRGYRRVLPTQDASWTVFAAPSAGSGSSALIQALKTKGNQFFSTGGAIPSVNGQLGAADVFEVSAGFYSAFHLAVNTAPSYAARAGGISKLQPLIIRAKKKVDGTPEAVLIARNASSQDTFNYQITNNSGRYTHFYDIKWSTSARTGIVTDKQANSGANGFDTFYEDTIFERCALLGSYDPRMIELAPFRATQSTQQSPTLSPQTQWDGGGNVITMPPSASPRNSFLWDMGIHVQSVHNALNESKYCVSVRKNESVSIPILLKTPVATGYTGATAPFLNVGVDNQGGVGIYAVVSVAGGGSLGGVNTATATANIEQYYDDGSGLMWRTTSGTLVRDVAHPSLTLPPTGNFVAGVAYYHNIRFKTRGVYNFNVVITDGTTTYLTTTCEVHVTDVGLSQPDSVIARCANLPTLRAKSVGGIYLTSKFSAPVEVNLSSLGATFAQANTRAPMVNGTLNYVIDSVSFAAGWRWSDSAGTELTSTNTLIGVIDNGVGNIYAGSGTAPGPVRLRYAGVGVPSVTNPITITVSRGSLFPVEMTFTSVSYVINLTIVTDPVTLDLPVGTINSSTPSGYVPTVDGAGKRFWGRVFHPGWPGNPSHPNYDAGAAKWFPSPGECPYVNYPHGIATKWGAQLWQFVEFTWNGGFGGFIQEEHVLYFHEPRNFKITNSHFKYTGRTSFQCFNRRQDNAPIPNNAPPENQFLNSSNVGGMVLIENNLFEDAGLDGTADGTVQGSIAEQGATVIVRGNRFFSGFNTGLRHYKSMGSGGLVVQDGTFWKPNPITPTTYRINFYFPNMVANDGTPLVNPNDLNDYLYDIPEVDPPTGPSYNPGFSILSPAHPARYLWELMRPYANNQAKNFLFADGTHFDEENEDKANFFGLKHPYRNRAFGHPVWSTTGKSDTRTLSTTLGVKTYGQPTLSFYAGMQQGTTVIIENNKAYMNSWEAGTVTIDTASSGANMTSKVRADWVVPGVRPKGLVSTSNRNTTGTGCKPAMDIEGAARFLSYVGNDVRSANLVALEFNSVLSEKYKAAPILDMSVYGNTIVGGFRYYGLSTGSSTPSQVVVSSLFSQLRSSTPSSNPF